MSDRSGVRSDPSRVQGFTDAVIAIIMTLLVIGLRLPHLPADLTASQVLDAFGDIAPKLIAFTASFFWVAIVCVNHHHVMSVVRTTARRWSRQGRLCRRSGQGLLPLLRDHQALRRHLV